MSTAELRCETHGTETRLRCAQCNTPICTECLVHTDVGLRCRECAEPVPAPTGGRRSRRGLAFGLALAGVGLLVAVVALLVVGPFDGQQEIIVAEEAVGEWSEAPPLNAVRGETSATALQDGQVAIVGGGLGAQALPATEVFDPEADTWSPAEALVQARRGHRVVRLEDGRLLAAGGIADGDVLGSAELFDPTEGTWESTDTMTQPRLGHSLTVLTDGRVLAAGGAGGERPEGAEDIQAQVVPSDTAEIYDPETGEWTAIGGMLAPRFEHTATALPDGRVLLAGGLSIAEEETAPTDSVELFDPSNGTFSRAAGMEVPRSDHAAVTLDDDRVLVVAGDLGGRVTGRVEVFDFERGSWTGVASLNGERRGHAATLLEDGTVLVSGGESVRDGARTSLGFAERYDPEADSWDRAGDMECPRSRHGQALLPDGRVLAAGGDAAFPGEPPVARSCVEIYDPE